MFFYTSRHRNDARLLEGTLKQNELLLRHKGLTLMFPVSNVHASYHEAARYSERKSSFGWFSWRLVDPKVFLSVLAKRFWFFSS